MVLGDYIRLLILTFQKPANEMLTEGNESNLYIAFNRITRSVVLALLQLRGPLIIDP